RGTGGLSEALPLQERVLAIRRELLGEAHRETGLADIQLGLVLNALGRKAESEASYRRALEALRASLGPKHPYAVIAARNVGICAEGRDDAVAAEPFIRDAVEGSAVAYGTKDSYYDACRKQLARILDRRAEADLERGDLAAARRACRERL